jgi:outer membrane protein assembly factor BamB
MHLKNNRVSCINLADGKEAWRTTPKGKYWSMVTNGEKIVALADDGKLMLIKPTPEEFTLISEKDVAEEPTWAHVAVLDNHVYVRRLKGLDCYRWA